MLVHNSIARAPEFEQVYRGRLITVVPEQGTGSIFFRYYLDGKRGCGYSTVDVAVGAAKRKVDGAEIKQ